MVLTLVEFDGNMVHRMSTYFDLKVKVDKKVLSIVLFSSSFQIIAENWVRAVRHVPLSQHFYLWPLCHSPRSV